MQNSQGRRGLRFGGQGGCERRFEFVKMQKQNQGVGGQGGWERRSEVIVKMQKIVGRGGSGPVGDASRG